MHPNPLPIKQYEQAKVVSESCFSRDRHRESPSLKAATPRLPKTAWPLFSQASGPQHLLPTYRDPAGPRLPFPLLACCAVATDFLARLGPTHPEPVDQKQKGRAWDHRVVLGKLSHTPRISRLLPSQIQHSPHRSSMTESDPTSHYPASVSFRNYGAKSNCPRIFLSSSL